jgi:hypothetical protein
MWNKLAAENMSYSFADIIGCDNYNDSDTYMFDDSI